MGPGMRVGCPHILAFPPLHASSSTMSTVSLLPLCPFSFPLYLFFPISLSTLLLFPGFYQKPSESNLCSLRWNKEDMNKEDMGVMKWKFPRGDAPWRSLWLAKSSQGQVTGWPSQAIGRRKLQQLAYPEVHCYFSPPSSSEHSPDGPEGTSSLMLIVYPPASCPRKARQSSVREFPPTFPV